MENFNIFLFWVFVTWSILCFIYLSIYFKNSVVNPQKFCPNQKKKKKKKKKKKPWISYIFLDSLKALFNQSIQVPSNVKKCQIILNPTFCISLHCYQKIGIKFWLNDFPSKIKIWKFVYATQEPSFSYFIHSTYRTLTYKNTQTILKQIKNMLL